MFISCPKCSTSYTIDGRNIDSDGTAVRCFKCGESWQQFPEPILRVQKTQPKPPASLPDTAQQTPELSDQNTQFYGSGYLPPNQGSGPAIPYPPYYPPPPPNLEAGAIPPYPPYPPPYPPYYPPPQQIIQNQSPGANVAPEEAQPDATNPSDTTPVESLNEEKSPSAEPVDESSLPSDEELANALGDDDDIKPIASAASQSTEDITELSEEELENLGDPDPIGGTGSQEKVELEDQDIDPEDLPDPDPIPGAGEEIESGDKKRSFKGIVISLIVLVIFGGLIAGLIIMRHTVAGIWPGANGLLYDWMGLRVAQPGDGLELSLKSPQRKTEKGKDIIIFEVVIQNTTNQTQRVPIVISSLTDAEGNQVQEITTDPSKPTLEAGKILRFQAKFPDAPAAAKQSIAKWGPYPSSSGENQNK